MAFFSPFDYSNFVDSLDQGTEYPQVRYRQQRQQPRQAPEQYYFHPQSQRQGQRQIQRQSRGPRAQQYGQPRGYPVYGYPQYAYQYAPEPEPEQETETFTLEDVLNLVNRHQSRNPYTEQQKQQQQRVEQQKAEQQKFLQERQRALQERQQQTLRQRAEREQQERKEICEVLENLSQRGSAEPAEQEAEKESQNEAQKEADSREFERSAPVQFDLADFIRQALAGAQQEEGEQEQETVAEKTDSEEADTVAKHEGSSPHEKPSLPHRTNSFSELTAPSPVRDPIQVSQPQFAGNLPFSPRIDVYDKPESYHVILALPGASKSSFEIDFHPTNQELYIKGSTSSREQTQKDDTCAQYLTVSEIEFGKFDRTIKFPILQKIKDDEITAKYSNGLLEVVVPKVPKQKEPVKPKKRVTVEEVEDEELKFEDGLTNL